MSNLSVSNHSAGLSKSQRIVVIIHLCLVLSLLLWYAFQPFMGEYFNLKSRMLLYEYVMGTSNILKNRHAEDLEKLIRNTQRFSSLSQSEQTWIIQDYQQLENQALRPALKKILEGIKALLIDVSAFEMAWMTFSLLIMIFLLLRIEGAQEAVWIIAFLSIVYSFDNYQYGLKPEVPADLVLFPTEQNLLKDEKNIQWNQLSWIEQQNYLKKKWNDFLVERWVPQDIKDASLSQKYQLEEGEFNFTLARLKKLRQQPLSNVYMRSHEKVPVYYLVLYMIWNIYLACFISGFFKTIQSLKKKKLAIIDV